MKMVLAVVNEQIVAGLIETLLDKQFRVTRLDSWGGFLRRGNVTIMSGVEDDEVQVVVQTIKDYAEKKKLKNIEGASVHQRKMSYEGLATVFVLPIEKIINF